MADTKPQGFVFPTNNATSKKRAEHDDMDNDDYDCVCLVSFSHLRPTSWLSMGGVKEFEYELYSSYSKNLLRDP
ncbi:hypothetical protein GBA52_017016 [Prunus armeniaca]|nr:hypothetical protein GBA52_017016 [Prunus armeniaca]